MRLSGKKIYMPKWILAGFLSALMLVGWSPSPEHKKVLELIRQFQSNSLSVGRIERALEKMGKPAVGALLEIINSNDDITARCDAVRVLAGLREPGVVKALVEVAKNSPPDMLECTVCALAKMRGLDKYSDIAAKIYTGVLSGDSTGVFKCALTGLKKIARYINRDSTVHLEMTEKLLQVIKQTGQDGLRIEALKTLAACQNSMKITVAFFDMMADKNPKAVKIAVSTIDGYSFSSSSERYDILLTYLEEEKNVDKLTAALNNGESRVRSGVLRILENISIKGTKLAETIARKLMVNVLKNPDYHYDHWREVLEILVRIGGTHAHDGFLYSLGHKSDKLRESACNVLAHDAAVPNEFPVIVTVIIKLLKHDPASRVRMYACQALGRVRSRYPVKTENAVIKALKDKDATVQRVAYNVLRDFSTWKAQKACLDYKNRRKK
ncbi:MAG: HEAT repeat domain-containing protein [bacterium]|nr:HEAT repeat domain-containing protein [bacterium]